MLSNRRKTETDHFDPNLGNDDYRIMRGSEVDDDMTLAVNRALTENNAQESGANMGPNMGPSVAPNIDQSNPMTIPKSNFVINVNSQTDGMVIVETDHQAKRFSFYTPQKSFIGSFSVLEYIKYVTSRVSGNFLKTVDAYSAGAIIEKYIGTIHKVEAPTVRYVINMHNYVESPFMGNVETLIKFYTFISEFEKSGMESELTSPYMETEERIAVRNLFDQMVYTLLTHILKIIAALTNKIVSNKDADPIKAKEIKDSLLMYSVSIMYRLSKFVKTDINKKIEEIDGLNADLLRIEAIRSNVTSKLDSIQKQIDLQNSRLDYMIRSGTNVQTAKDEIEGEDFDEESEEAGYTSSSTISSTLDRNAVIDNDRSNLSHPDVHSVDTELASVISTLNRLENESAMKGGFTSSSKEDYRAIDGVKQVLTSNTSRASASANANASSAKHGISSSSQSQSSQSQTSQTSQSQTSKSQSPITISSSSSVPKSLEDLLVN